MQKVLLSFLITGALFFYACGGESTTKDPNPDDTTAVDDAKASDENSSDKMVDSTNTESNEKKIEKVDATTEETP